MGGHMDMFADNTLRTTSSLQPNSPIIRLANGNRSCRGTLDWLTWLSPSYYGNIGITTRQRKWVHYILPVSWAYLSAGCVCEYAQLIGGGFGFFTYLHRQVSICVHYLPIQVSISCSRVPMS